MVIYQQRPGHLLKGNKTMEYYSSLGYCVSYRNQSFVFLCKTKTGLYMKRNFIKKETPTQALSYEFCEIFKNNFLIEHLPCLLLNFSDKKKSK